MSIGILESHQCLLKQVGELTLYELVSMDSHKKPTVNCLALGDSHMLTCGRGKKIKNVHMKHFCWKKIIWSSVEKRIQRLKLRIYKASSQGNQKKVHFLQYQLIQSLDAKLLAIRKVTVENQDKSLSISTSEKMRLVKRLKIETTPCNEIIFRARQELIILALEPQWEALFEANSYGGRPGRTAQDAIESVFLALRVKSKISSSERFIFKAKLSTLSLNIDSFIKKLNTIPPIAEIVRTWSPEELPAFFVNIIFHGLENYLKEWIIYQNWPTTQRHQTHTANKIKSISIIRYLKDFLIIHSNKEIVQRAKEATSQWLDVEFRCGLFEKSLLVSSRESFEFLEFRFISLYFQNKYRTKIYPSKDAQKSIVKKVGNICRRYRALSTYDLIRTLRPILLSWGNYYSFCECKEIFGKIDRQIFQILRAWVFRRDRRRGRIAIKKKYFPSGRTFQFDNRQYKNNWVLCANKKLKEGILNEIFLPKIAWIQSRKYVKIKRNATPYDGNFLYWQKRLLLSVNKQKQYLLKKQSFSCLLCGGKFDFHSVMEVDHIIPRSKGGKDILSNLQLLHRHCHTEKTRLKDVLFSQELDEAKVSRPDLSTRFRDKSRS